MSQQEVSPESKRGIKVQKDYGKSRCDVKKKQFLRPRCKIAVKKSFLRSRSKNFQHASITSEKNFHLPFFDSRQPKPEQNSLMSWLLKILLWRPAFNFWRRVKPMIWHYLWDKRWTKGHLQRKLKSWKISSKLLKSENSDLLRLSRKLHQISEKYLIDLLVIVLIFPIELLFRGHP